MIIYMYGKYKSIYICSIAATVMDCIAEIGLDPNGVQKCVEVFIFLELTMVRMMTMMMIIIAGVQKCVEVSKYQRAIF